MTVDFTTYAELPGGARHLETLLNLTRSHFDEFAQSMIDTAHRILEEMIDNKTKMERWATRCEREGDEDFLRYVDSQLHDQHEEIMRFKKFIEAWVFLREGGQAQLLHVISFLPSVGIQCAHNTLWKSYVAQLLEKGIDTLHHVGNVEVYVA